MVVSEEGDGGARKQDEAGERERGDDPMAYASGACLCLCAKRVE